MIRSSPSLSIYRYTYIIHGRKLEKERELGTELALPLSLSIYIYTYIIHGRKFEKERQVQKERERDRDLESPRKSLGETALAGLKGSERHKNNAHAWAHIHIGKDVQG